MGGGRDTNIRPQQIVCSCHHWACETWSSSWRTLHNPEHRAKLFFIKNSERVCMSFQKIQPFVFTSESEILYLPSDSYQFSKNRRLFTYRLVARAYMSGVLRCNSTSHSANIEYQLYTGHSAKPCCQPTQGLVGWPLMIGRENTRELTRSGIICYHSFQE